MTELTLRLDPGVFRVEAVKNTAYRFAADYWVSVGFDENAAIIVTLKPKTDDGCDVVAAGDSFRNELLDQELRLVVWEKTSAVSALIMAHALSRVAVVGGDLDSADFRDDPRGIATES